jgi:predicted nucleic acid-binding protein
MIDSLFIDTGYWLVLFNKKDGNHQKAINSLKIISESKIFTSDFIIYETVTFFNASLKKNDLAKIFIDFIYSKPEIKILEVDGTVKNDALKLLLKFSDKYFSFTDCTSFILMNNYSIKKAYSFDQHFKQMGFEIL